MDDSVTVINPIKERRWNFSRPQPTISQFKNGIDESGGSGLAARAVAGESFQELGVKLSRSEVRIGKDSFVEWNGG